MRLFILENLFIQPLHGYGIMKRIMEKSGGFWRPMAGFIYPLLRDMAHEGLIAPVGRKDRRKLYTISEKGRAELLRLHREAEGALLNLTKVLSSYQHEAIKMQLQLFEKLSPKERTERIRSRLEVIEALIKTLSEMKEELERSISGESTEGDD